MRVDFTLHGCQWYANCVHRVNINSGPPTSQFFGSFPSMYLCPGTARTAIFSVPPRLFVLHSPTISREDIATEYSGDH